MATSRCAKIQPTTPGSKSALRGWLCHSGFRVRHMRAWHTAPAPAATQSWAFSGYINQPRLSLMGQFVPHRTVRVGACQRATDSD